jgi:hypothetical protein
MFSTGKGNENTVLRSNLGGATFGRMDVYGGRLDKCSLTSTGVEKYWRIRTWDCTLDGDSRLRYLDTHFGGTFGSWVSHRAAK